LGKFPHTLIASEQGENELDCICWDVMAPRLKMFCEVDEKGCGFLAGSANTGRVWCDIFVSMFEQLPCVAGVQYKPASHAFGSEGKSVGAQECA
jgi:hypothetical protein